MSLTSSLEQLLARRGVSKFDRMKVRSLIHSIEETVGPIDELDLVTAVFSQIVEVPRSPDKWIVVGEWDDGSMDIVRECPTSHEDILYGWKPGQSLQDYEESINEEEDGPRVVASTPKRTLLGLHSNEEYGSFKERTAKWREKQELMAAEVMG